MKTRTRRRRPPALIASAEAMLLTLAELFRYVWRTNRRRMPIVIVLMIIALIIGYSALIAPLTPFLYPLF